MGNGPEFGDDQRWAFTVSELEPQEPTTTGTHPGELPDFADDEHQTVVRVDRTMVSHDLSLDSSLDASMDASVDAPVDPPTPLDAPAGTGTGWNAETNITFRSNTSDYGRFAEGSMPAPSSPVRLPSETISTDGPLRLEAEDDTEDSVALSGLTLDGREEIFAEGELEQMPGLVTLEEGMTVAGRYEIVESIAAGGMGKVFLAKHTHLGKTFALKQMHRVLSANPTLKEQFYREARLASQLSHPNIVSVVDFGEDERSGTFMVMELVEGEPLAARLRKKEKLPLRMALEVILQMTDALDYIHRTGIVHGDIKPDNVLLRRAGSSDQRRWNITLLDFGLARPRHADVSQDSLDGTPAYMAPERLQGKPMGPAADIYSIGILAYQLLTGEVPFTGDFRTVLSKHMIEKPEPLSKVLGKEVDERLEALVAKSLEKDPADRHPTMAAFLFELKTLMDMLGFGRRRRGKKKGGDSSRGPEDVKNRLARRVFEQVSMAFAVVSARGTIVMANPVFANFLKIDPESKDTSILDPRFVRVHPELPLDLSRVVKTGETVKRGLALHKESGEQVLLMLTLAPLQGEKDKILLSLVPA